VALRLVSSEHGVPRVLGEVQKRGTREDARVVHEHIDRAQRPLGVGHEAPGLLGLRDIGADRCGPPPEGVDLPRRGLRGHLVVQEVERHIGAGLGKSQRNRAPDAALGARHEGGLSGAPLVRAHGRQGVPHSAELLERHWEEGEGSVELGQLELAGKGSRRFGAAIPT
jgi:hypothetical protein